MSSLYVPYFYNDDDHCDAGDPGLRPGRGRQAQFCRVREVLRVGDQNVPTLL